MYRMMEYKELASDIYIINLQDKGEERGHILVSWSSYRFPIIDTSGLDNRLMNGYEPILKPWFD